MLSDRRHEISIYMWVNLGLFRGFIMEKATQIIRFVDLIIHNFFTEFRWKDRQQWQISLSDGLKC